jgi:hypothetical protein
MVTDLAPLKPAAPFYERIPEILTFPFHDDGWMMLLGWAIFSLVMRPLGQLGGLIGGTIIWFIYYSLLISYFYRVVAHAEDGKFQVPNWTSFEGVGISLVGPVFKFFLTTVIVFWPMVAFIALAFFLRDTPLLKELFNGPLGIVTFCILALAGLFFEPMAILVMGVFGSIKFVANPVFLLRQINKVRFDYLLVYGLLVGLLLNYVLIYILLHLLITTLGLLKYLLVFPLDGVLQLYLFMVVGHLLGYLAFQNRFRLQWWPDCLEEPRFLVQGKPQTLRWDPTIRPATAGGGGGLAGLAVAGAAAGGPAASAASPPASRPAAATARPSSAPGAGTKATTATARPATASPQRAPAAVTLSAAEQEELTRRINDGMSLIEHGRHEEAAALYDEVLARDPEHLGALRGRMLAATGLKDQAAAEEYARRLGQELTRQQAFDPLWEVYSEMRASSPNFILRPRDQLALCKWLAGEGRHLDAAKLLREVGVGCPEDPLAPKALYQCAELLWKNCGKADAAGKMFDYILKRYPETAFADQVRAALAQLRPRA